MLLDYYYDNKMILAHDLVNTVMMSSNCRNSQNYHLHTVAHPVPCFIKNNILSIQFFCNSSLIFSSTIASFYVQHMQTNSSISAV